MPLYIFHTLFFLLLNAILYLRSIQIIEISIIGAWWFFLSWLSVMSCVGVLDLVGRIFKNRTWRSFVFYIYWMIYVFVFIYHYRARDVLNFSLIGDNISLLFYGESVVVVGAFYKTKDYFTYAAIFVTYALLWNRFKIYEAKLPAKWVGGGLLASILLLAIYPYNFYDELGQFGHSVASYYRSESSSEVEEKLIQEKPYPYKVDSPLVKPANPPNVVFIPIESFNANFVGKKTADGREITPFINELINSGVYVEKYYGNTVQTAKGHFAILCGVIPLSSGKVATRYSHHNFHCLPEILKDFGYLTLYFQAHRELTFDNKAVFMKSMGFDVVDVVDTDKLSASDKAKYVWGWGAQDDIMYQQGFAKLDELVAEKTRPVFFMLQGVSSHMMFDNVPKEQRALFPDQNSKEENYSNALHVTDAYLRTFFDELNKRDYMKNTIVVITGDHSFPVGEHGIYHNERSFYNEFFKTPLIIVWPEKLRPRRIKNLNASHLDLGPTVLDLMDASSPNHFLGRSIFSEDFVPRAPIPLVQPYAGKYLAIVDGDYKFVQHMRTKRQYLFNLSADPHELHNLIDDENFVPIVARMEQSLSLFKLNDILIQRNLVYPF